ncbi:MAG: hypothetical protein IMF12_00275 [Proteobacteria bacterium]|nr:hypothetical protein [Pseudomonadota bacterium]
MSHITLEHIKVNELPPTWVKQLPDVQTVTVVIIAENDNGQNEMYLNDLHSQGIDINRLRESIQQLKTGEVNAVKLEDMDEYLDEFIKNANTETNNKC